MIGLLSCLHNKCFWRKPLALAQTRSNDRGSLTVEAMMTLPALLIALLLCAGLVYSVHGALVLDRAMAYSCSELAENNYMLLQAVGMGVDLVSAGRSQQVRVLSQSGAATELAGGLAGYALASACLDKHLKGHDDIKSAVRLQMARMPMQPCDTRMREVGWGIDWKAAWGEFVFDEDDVVLIITFTPAKLNRVTSILPDSWQITMVKRERAWLIGRNLPPHRGLEQAAGQKGKGPLVFITNWGIKYHMDGCRYLAKSKIPAYLNELSEAYGACSVCKPPPR